TYTVPIWVRSAVTDQVETELAFGRFNAPISVANRRTKGADFHLRVDDRAGRNLFECLLQNSDALAHLQHAHHQPIVSVPVFAQRNPEFEARIESVAVVHLSHIIIHATGAKHRTGNTGT